VRFWLVDSITNHAVGEGLVASKGVSYAEPYLADHFPGAPIYPGALMVQTAVEAATWYMRKERDFSFEDIEVASLRQAKFSRVVRPGDVLRVHVRVDASNTDVPDTSSFRARGWVGDAKAFSVRFSLRARPVSDTEEFEIRRQSVSRAQREHWSILTA